MLPPAIFKHVFDAYNFFVILSLFDSYEPYALSMHNRQCANKMHHLVSLATHSQSRLNSFQTVKTLFCIALPGHLDFISFLGCALFLAGDWPQTTIPNERAYNY